MWTKYTLKFNSFGRYGSIKHICRKLEQFLQTKTYSDFLAFLSALIHNFFLYGIRVQYYSTFSTCPYPLINRYMVFSELTFWIESIKAVLDIIILGKGLRYNI